MLSFLMLLVHSAAASDGGMQPENIEAAEEAANFQTIQGVDDDEQRKRTALELEQDTTLENIMDALAMARDIETWNSYASPAKPPIDQQDSKGFYGSKLVQLYGDPASTTDLFFMHTNAPIFNVDDGQVLWGFGRKKMGEWVRNLIANRVNLLKLDNPLHRHFIFGEFSDSATKNSNDSVLIFAPGPYSGTLQYLPFHCENPQEILTLISNGQIPVISWSVTLDFFKEEIRRELSWVEIEAGVGKHVYQGELTENSIALALVLNSMAKTDLEATKRLAQPYASFLDFFFESGHDLVTEASPENEGLQALKTWREEHKRKEAPAAAEA